MQCEKTGKDYYDSKRGEKIGCQKFLMSYTKSRTAWKNKHCFTHWDTGKFILHYYKNLELEQFLFKNRERNLSANYKNLDKMYVD